MFKKYYTANVVDKEGNLIGAGCASCWFWHSPYYVQGELAKDFQDGVYIVSFRRVY